MADKENTATQTIIEHEPKQRRCCQKEASVGDLNVSTMSEHLQYKYLMYLKEVSQVKSYFT